MISVLSDPMVNNCMSSNSKDLNSSVVVSSSLHLDHPSLQPPHHSPDSVVSMATSSNNLSLGTSTQHHHHRGVRILVDARLN